MSMEVTTDINAALVDDESSELTRDTLVQLARRVEFAGAPELAGVFSLPPATISAIQSIHDDAQSRNTQRSYAAARRYWHAWYALRYRSPLTLPVPPAAVLQFIIDHVEHWPDPADKARTEYLLPGWIEEQLVELGLKRRGAWKVNTIEHRVSALSSMHDEIRDEHGDPGPNPCRDPYVVRLLRKVRKAHAKNGRLEVRRDAVTTLELASMLARCAGESLRDVRARAILLVGFAAGGRRRSEIAGLTVEKLVSSGDNYLWKLGQTKTSGGKDVPIQKPIKGRAADALRAWLGRAGISSGPVFREIVGNDGITERPMSDQAIYRLVRSLAKRAGLTGAWGAHSLRSGFVTEAGRKNIAIGEVMKLTDHANFSTIQRYYRTGEVLESPAADLADGIAPPTADARPQRAGRPSGRQQRNGREPSRRRPTT